MYLRICPQCNKELPYKSLDALNNANRKGSICRSCSVKNCYIKNPNKNKGIANGRTGKSLVSLMRKKHGEKFEEVFKKWKTSLNSFKCGKENPSYGVPSHKNSGCSYKGWYKGLFFRSTLELLFIFQYEKENGAMPVSAEGMFKIKYGTDRNYIPDFFCPMTRTIYELKCSKFLNQNKEKFEAGLKYCEEHDYYYKVITEKEISGFKDYDLLVKELESLHANGVIRLTDKSIKKLEKRLKRNLLEKLS